MPKTSHIKLLAPAGSYESLRAAIASGCNAIYFGVTQLNMRAVAASNFDLSDLAEITKLCHENDVEAHLALNTILYEHDIVLMKRIVDVAKEHGVDTIIASDIAAITYAHSIGQSVHISTMQSISNYEAVKYFAQFADVVVLAREVTLPMVKRIHDQIVEDDLRGPGGDQVKIEIFAHGALCIAVSGQCFMSLYNHNASACRGACRQECRRSYRIIDDDTKQEMVIRNNFVMSPADLCTIGILDKLVEAGVSVLKFEGRGRPPEYVDTVIRCYREALEAIEQETYTPEKIGAWRAKLEKVYNRKFSTGYYLGATSDFWAESGHNQAKEERAFVGKVTHFYPKVGVAEIYLEAGTVEVGQNIIFTGKTTGLVRSTIEDLRSEDKKPITKGERKTIVTIEVAELVRRGDKVYTLTPRKDFR